MKSLRSVKWMMLAGMAGRALASGPDGRPPPPPPSAEATAACSGQSDGAACSFMQDGQSVTGICRAGPRGEAAACMPPHPPHHRPPPEAFEACSGKTGGAACSVTMGNEALPGICRSGPGDSALACEPGEPPQR